LPASQYTPLQRNIDGDDQACGRTFYRRREPLKRESMIFVWRTVRVSSRNAASQPHKILRFDREDFYLRLGYRRWRIRALVRRVACPAVRLDKTKARQKKGLPKKGLPKKGLPKKGLPKKGLPKKACQKNNAKPLRCAMAKLGEGTMSKRSHSPNAGRRNFLKGATLAGAAALTTPVAANVPASDLSEEHAKAAAPGPRAAAVAISWSMC
jgi:hypothetical protein